MRAHGASFRATVPLLQQRAGAYGSHSCPGLVCQRLDTHAVSAQPRFQEPNPRTRTQRSGEPDSYWHSATWSGHITAGVLRRDASVRAVRQPYEADVQGGCRLLAAVGCRSSSAAAMSRVQMSAVTVSPSIATSAQLRFQRPTASCSTANTRSLLGFVPRASGPRHRTVPRPIIRCFPSGPRVPRRQMPPRRGIVQGGAVCGWWESQHRNATLSPSAQLL
jgi:hypothetical protein